MDWDSGWRWLLGKGHRDAVGFLGARVAAVVTAYGALSAVTVQADPEESRFQGGVDITASEQVVDTTPIAASTGSIPQVQRLSTEKLDALANQLGVGEAAINRFLTIIECPPVSLSSHLRTVLERKLRLGSESGDQIVPECPQVLPPQDADNTLREMAKHYKELEARLTTFSSNDLVVTSLKTAARSASTKGFLDRAEELLEVAKEMDLKAAEAAQEGGREYLRSAAETAAALGALKDTKLLTAEAAQYYAEAARLLPEGEELVRAEYLSFAGLRWTKLGERRNAVASLQQALAIREQLLGPQHPLVATSIRNLANDYYAWGHYAPAEPLLERALPIFENALGPTHPLVDETRRNLANVYHHLYDERYCPYHHDREMRELLCMKPLKASTSSRSHASRLFAGKAQYPPKNFAAYGIVAFRSVARAHDFKRFILVCEAYTAVITHSEELRDVPFNDQLVTVWPVKSAELADNLNGVSADDPTTCEAAVTNYDLVVSRKAIKEAELAGFSATGSGPYLLAWSPPRTKGSRDALVLVADLSYITDYGEIRAVFLKWADDIEQNPELWKKGWQIEQVRRMLRTWADRFGPRLLSLVTGS